MTETKTGTEKQDILTKIENLDVRIIYFFVIIAVAYPIISPLGLPIPTSEPTMDIYDFIENLPEGSVVLVGSEVGAGAWSEIGPSLNILMQHLFDNNLKPIIISSVVDGAMMAEMYTIPKMIAPGKVYGTDWVNLGYLAGAEPGIAAFATQITSVKPVDYFDTPVEDLEMMKNVKSAADFDLAIICTWGDYEYLQYLRQYAIRFDVPIVVGAKSDMIPGLHPFYESKQVLGYLNGLRGAGEYEILTGHLGYAAASLDASSTYHLVVFALIVIGNLAMVARMFTKNKEGT